ncbi:MAG: PhoU domain-containing protein [Planctomycetota bacterium]
MFKWFRKLDVAHSGLAKILREFERMLEEGRRVFDLATDAYLSLADARTLRDKLVETDKEINRLEQQIRREVVIHATVYGATEFPACLVLMSITKDAERIGDESKNILDVATYRPKAHGAPYYDQLLDLKGRVLDILTETRRLYEAQDTERAPAFIETTEILKDECDDAVEEILRAEKPVSVVPSDPVGTALCFRYYKRVISHARNIVTSIVVPVDQLDYFDESKETRDGDPPL